MYNLNKMQDIPPCSQQIDLINMEMKKPATDFYCMIATTWWHRWNLHCKDPFQDFVVHPGPINNTDLLYFYFFRVSSFKAHSHNRNYDISFFSTDDSVKYSCTDWTKMSLKQDLKADTHFMLINEEVWYILSFHFLPFLL